jgi:phage shock protein B
LDDRICSIERIMTADNPDWRRQCLPPEGEVRDRILPSRENV